MGMLSSIFHHAGVATEGQFQKVVYLFTSTSEKGLFSPK